MTVFQLFLHEVLYNLNKYLAGYIQTAWESNVFTGVYDSINGEGLGIPGTRSFLWGVVYTKEVRYLRGRISRG